jgi:thioredoxin-related protein
MKKISMILLALFFVLKTEAQEKKLYNPQADASKDIGQAIVKAKKENKFVLLQAGGNWCKWCLEFERFCKADTAIDSIMNASFVWYHLNYSRENRNKKLFAKYGYPQRFGFPVLIILNAKGERIHTQDSEYLEDGKKSYDREKLISFLKMWSPAALKAEQYEK